MSHSLRKFPGAKPRVQPANPGAHPPVTLSAEAQTVWRQLRDEYGISDAGGLLVLSTACEAFDRMKEAQRVLASAGSTVVDRFGCVKAHPSVVIERDARAGLLQALKALNLDLEPLHARPGRPPGS